MLKDKKILVTSGGTQEYIDDVRVLTNISSGKLGAKITESLINAGAHVTYLHGRNAAKPSFVDLPMELHPSLREMLEVRTAQDAYNEMEKLVPSMDAVVHCMAVSDFTFKRDTAVKLSSSDPEAFIEFMRKTITKNPKIISKIKGWNPKTVLVGFKFEVGIPNDSLIKLGLNSITSNGCDLVVVNDKKEMEARKEHVAYLVQTNSVAVAVGKESIANGIVQFLKEQL